MADQSDDGISLRVGFYANFRTPPVAILDVSHLPDEEIATLECPGGCTCGGCACSMCGANAMDCDGQCSQPVEVES